MGLLGDIKGYLAEKLDFHISNTPKSKKSKIINKTKTNTGDNSPVVNLTINIANVQDNEMEETKKLLIEEFKNNNLVFMKDETKALVDDVEKSVVSGSEEDKIIKFFTPILNQTDLLIVRSGIYVKYLSENGFKVEPIRSNIIRSYGIRGKNLLNLASSHHLKKHIKPLYEGMGKSDNFTAEDFYRELNAILEEMPFAIFVNQSVSEQELVRLIREKANKSIKYAVGNKKIYIHGWGNNASTIENVLKKLPSEVQTVSTTKREEHFAIIEVILKIKK